MARPAIALEWLSLNRRGEVLLALKRPFRDGATHLTFTPEDFIARLAALLRAIHGAHPADRWCRGRGRT